MCRDKMEGVQGQRSSGIKSKVYWSSDHGMKETHRGRHMQGKMKDPFHRTTIGIMPLYNLEMQADTCHYKGLGHDGK